MLGGPADGEDDHGNDCQQDPRLELHAPLFTSRDVFVKVSRGQNSLHKETETTEEKGLEHFYQCSSERLLLRNW